jgi:hypothetical protein
MSMLPSLAGRADLNRAADRLPGTSAPGVSGYSGAF